MDRKIVITKKDTCIYTSLLEDGIFAEIHCTETEKDKTEALPGDIYIGRVKQIRPNIGAAFIEIAPGYECYCPLKQLSHPVFTKKSGKQELCAGDELIVQINKEAAKGKAPGVTTKFSLSGELAVLTHGNTTLGVSGKIPDKQRTLMKEWITPYQNEDYGLILRTNAAFVESEKVFAQIEALQNQYQELICNAEHRVCFSCLYRETEEYLLSFRNIYAEGLSEIVVEDDLLFGQIHDFLETVRPDILPCLRRYADPLLPLHKLYRIDIELQKALSERVWLDNGGYLVIQPTEALTVIDVNSGKCIQGKDVQKTYFKTNLAAAIEAARQIRLRNLSGIILVDFINMQNPEDTEQLLCLFRKELAKDPVLTTLVDITKLQLVEVTRKKVRKPLSESVKGIVNKDE